MTDCFEIIPYYFVFLQAKKYLPQTATIYATSSSILIFQKIGNYFTDFNFRGLILTMKFMKIGRRENSRFTVSIPKHYIFEPPRDKTISVVALSDQSLLCPHEESLATHWAHSEDWSDWADAQTDLSLHWVHSHFVGFVMRWLIWKTSSFFPCLIYFNVMLSSYFIKNKTASHARCTATAVISSKWQISHVKSKESCKVPVKFQKDWPKTVGRVADTRHILPIHICSIKAWKNV